ncbi:hypothetical protein QQY66_13715 [Streptomyces sp. DG2A-72]|uniref:hypothetical protein n=1 Tax=Streptomyces sp. DG2A-72 TaxID=3051386 RepID=UPI00265BBC35|nr:hypothetical protein [Streptomyces sp. DG2A-72]MDO0932698.1 hypothetical protein [Streptomyces sp. DG2A-72]
MTNTHIALLLADAADEVEIGIAPYQAVIRGGRRRRARRWAVVAATALVLTGSAGTLAIAGMPGGDRDRGSVVATRPPTTEAPSVVDPQRTLLGFGTDGGKDWQVAIDVWTAPRDESEARLQVSAMTDHGEFPAGLRQDSELIGKSTYFVYRLDGEGEETTVMEGQLTHDDTMSGADIEAGAIRLTTDSDAAQRLVVGQVAPTVQRVTCTWKNGTTTDVHRVPKGYDVNSDDQVIRPVDGSPVNWFVCVAPEGTAYQEVKVTK